MIRTLFVPGSSWLHRMRPGPKLAALPLAGTALFLFHQPSAMAAALLVVLALFRSAGLPLSQAFGQLRPAVWALLLLFAVQCWFQSLETATTTTLRLGALILLASLVTLTTRTSEMVDTLERALAPFRPLGVDPEKIGLAISLALRFIPAVGAVVADVREAQRARGLERSMVALAVPAIVRTLKMADEIAEAIDARS